MGYSYKQVLSDLAQIFYHHEQIQSFGFGDIEQITNDIESKTEPKYIRAYVVPGNTFFNQNEIHYNFSVIVMDKVEEDLSNLKDVMSDTLSITQDIWTALYQSYKPEYGNFSWYVNPDQNSMVIPFTEKYETIVAGYTLNLSLSIPFDYNRCTPPVKFNYGFPQDQTFESFRVILDDMETFANLHEQIRSFGYGDIPQLTNDILTKQEPKYPRMYVHFDNSIIHTGNIQMSYNIFFVDKVEDDLSNLQDVLSDTLEIAQDLFSKLYLSDYEAYFNPSVECFLEKTETIVAGWVLNVNMQQKFDYNRCVLPIYNFSPGLTWEEVNELWRKKSNKWENV